MRRFLVAVTVLLACISTASAQGWQWLNPLPQGNTLSDIDYLGNNQLYSTGYFGTAISSSDGGTTWAMRQTGEHPSPTQVDFVSTTEGWGITDYYSWRFGDELANTIFHTTDGGLTWLPQYHNPLVSLWGISFPTTECGWVMGTVDTASYNLVVLHTTNGGLTWSEQVHDSNGFGGGHVFFLNEQEGWISRERAVLHTADAGATWQWYTIPYDFYFDMIFADSQNGWGAGFSNVYHTADGGQTWVPLNLPDANYYWFTSVAVADPSHIWVSADGSGHEVAAGRVYQSSNGGQTWTSSVLDSTNGLNHVVFADTQHGWVCGYDGDVFQTVNGGTTWMRRAGDMITDGAYYFHAVSFADLQNGWIAGSSWDTTSPILHSTDGGLTWAVQYVDTSAYSFITDIKAVSNTNIWAVGSHVLHSTDGGEHWSIVNSGELSWGLKIACPDNQTIWIVSGWTDPQVHRSTDGGTTWETHDVDGIYKFNTMTASDSNNLWVTSWWDLLDEGEVSHSSDGGVTWEPQMELGGEIDAIFFVDSLHGWARSWPGLVRTSDGGDTWTPAGNDTLYDINQIQFLDTLNGWAAGSEAYRTTDGGTTWQKFAQYSERSVQDMDFVDPTHGWLLGYGNSVLRFDGSIFSTPDLPAPVPSSFTLHPAYPNPFNSTTSLRFDVPFAGKVKVEVFDITGRLVQTLTDQLYTPGTHVIRFDAEGFSSGLYFARATSGSLRTIQKLVLLK